jgi:betaine reductase
LSIFKGKERKRVSTRLRIVHYINQFFAGIGGEDKARVGPQVKVGPVGPGKALQEALKDWGEVIATVICGDDYFTEKMEEAVQEVIRLILPYQPGLVIAGPAFNAGRYGIACGEICKAVQDKLKIPSVTGMYGENPGVELYKKDVYIVKTVDSVRGMTEAISLMVKIARKLSAKEKIGRPVEEGYFPQGYLKTEISDKTAAERGIDMLLAKLKGHPFESELPLPKFDRVPPPPPVSNLSTSTIALVTDGGVVPKGNPDKIQGSKATRFGSYSIKEVKTLSAQEYEVIHIGYDTVFIAQNPNILVPVDVMRDFEKEGMIGKLYETFYSTVGVGTTLESSKKIGQSIAKRLQADGVTAVILTST